MRAIPVAAVAEVAGFQDAFFELHTAEVVARFVYVGVPGDELCAVFPCLAGRQASAIHIPEAARASVRAQGEGQVEDVVLGSGGAGGNHVAIGIVAVVAGGAGHALGLGIGVGYYIRHTLQYGACSIIRRTAGVGIVQVVYEVIHRRGAVHAHKATSGEVLDDLTKRVEPA